MIRHLRISTAKTSGGHFFSKLFRDAIVCFSRARKAFGVASIDCKLHVRERDQSEEEKEEAEQRKPEQERAEGGEKQNRIWA